MIAHEIRIGNWVHHNNEWSARNEDKKGVFDYQFEQRDWYWDAECLLNIEENLSPIPLTEEWLKRFGFENQTKRCKESIIRWKKNCVTLFPSDGYPYGASIDIDSPIQYVHQLQNLIFALTGEELTLSQ